MEYRSSDPIDDGFESAAEEQDAMRHFVQHVMSSDDDSLMDTLLICANACETKSLLYSALNPSHARWLRNTGIMLRQILMVQSVGQDAPKPNVKLEMEYLYFPETEQTH